MKLTIMNWLVSPMMLLAAVPVIGQEIRDPGASVQQTERPKNLTPPTPPQAAVLNDSDELAAASTDKYDVLMSGPIHEAFAEPNAQADVKDLIVAKQPPEPIDEVPPDVQPEGENIEWIPGYWGWDQASDDFVWVTGLWRQMPPDRQWVPGYWNQIEDGYQWVSGFWADENVDEIAYLPPPPALPESGPSTPPPGDNYFWVPGHWSYADNQYQLQSGFWAEQNPDWIWINTAYLPTPQGYVYRSGYWDYQLGHRGTIFCPVRFNSGYSGNYRPNYVMNVGVNWLANLFVHPGYRHYYFGNYYGAQFQQSMHPWVSYYQGPQYYDPLYSYYRASHQNYIGQVNQMHQQFAQQQQFRPAATVVAQQKLEQEMGQNNNSLAFNTATIAALALAGHQLSKANNNNSFNNNAFVESNAAFQFKKMDKTAIDKVNASLKPVKELQQHRRNFEKTIHDSGSKNTGVANATPADSRTTGRDNKAANGKPNGTASNTANNAVKGDSAKVDNPSKAGASADTKANGRDDNAANGKPNGTASNTANNAVKGNTAKDDNLSKTGASTDTKANGRDNNAANGKPNGTASNTANNPAKGDSAKADNPSKAGASTDTKANGRDDNAANGKPNGTASNAANNAAKGNSAKDDNPSKSGASADTKAKLKLPTKADRGQSSSARIDRPNADPGKVGDANKGRGNAATKDLPGPGNPGIDKSPNFPKNQAPANPPRGELPGNRQPGNNRGEGRGDALKGALPGGSRQPQVNPPVGGGGAPSRSAPPRGTMPNLPPVPHTPAPGPAPAGKSGGLITGGSPGKGDSPAAGGAKSGNAGAPGGGGGEKGKKR